MPKRDYYDILGVSEQASDEDIKRVYRNLAKKYHPDANKGDKNAEAKFKEISEAYNVLRDPQKRRKYDQMRKYGAFTDGGSGGFDFRGFDFGGFDFGHSWNNTANRNQTGGGFSFEDFFGLGGLGDIFSDLFDRGDRIRKERTGKRQKGAALHSELTIPFEVAIHGGKQVINLVLEEPCVQCNGTGAEKGTTPKTCPDCHGRGTISISQGFFAVNRTCPRCFGRGTIIEKICPVCQGTGEIKRNKKLAITIPPGIEDETKLRLRGQGTTGTKGGSRGDIIITIRIAPHRFFKRQGKDIYCEVPLDIIKAIQGAKIRIKTVYNHKVDVVIPPGTKDGKTFRLKKLGVKTKDGVGDQYVTIKLVRRANLTDEERKIIETFESDGKHD
ncbi:MAG: molecular chaperone DnaJ [candidate division KSB1 bacterium]|nr:molecular chaperone DnaJ [candidate division KSB1 bacterium]MDZ7317925.1 molecular chaperone DnaJ [candidate division KSB1 bacterium]MDZ7340696.1 molecular chaperone DnaJ [candidate division KSB1 bacterium]